jgi:hypothetical protein
VARLTVEVPSRLPQYVDVIAQICDIGL